MLEEDQFVICNIKMKNSGCLVLICDVEMVLYDAEGDPVEILLPEVCYFEKGPEIWVNMPSRSWLSEGKKCYKHMIKFLDPDVKETCSDIIVKKIKEELSKTKPPEEHKEEEDLPF